MNDRTDSVESARNTRRMTWTDTGPIRRAWHATEEETARARELGSAAYDRNAEHAPLLDGEFVGLLGEPPVGEPRRSTCSPRGRTPTPSAWTPLLPRS